MATEPKIVLYRADAINAVYTHDGYVLMEFTMPDAGLTPKQRIAFRLEPAHAEEMATMLTLAAKQARGDVDH